MTALNLGIPYLTRAELVGMNPLLPLTLFSGDSQDNLISRASRAIDGYVHTFFGAAPVGWPIPERHEWSKENLRSFPIHWPILRVARFRIYVSNKMYVNIPIDQVFISQTEHYIQIVSPALIASFASPVFTLTMAIPSAEIIYAAGRGDFTTIGSPLCADVDQTVVILPVDDASQFSPGDVIRIETLNPDPLLLISGTVPVGLSTQSVIDEWMIVTATDAAGSPQTITVNQRGDYGTIVLPHKDDDIIYKLNTLIPDKVKVACSDTVANYVVQQILLQQGLGGLKNATLGNYSVGVAAPGGGGDMTIPDSAKVMLDEFRIIGWG